MTEVQEILLELLTEIDTICECENIKYYLCKETAHSAFMQNAFYPESCEANVAMTADDVLKFMAAVEKENRADRFVDSMANNKRYVGFSVRYGNRNTTMIPMFYNNNTGALPAIAVNISIIRYKPKRTSKFYKRSNRFLENCQKPMAECKYLPALLSVGSAHIVKKIFGEAKIRRRLFIKWCGIFSENKNASKIAIGSKKYKCDASLLKCYDTIEFEGKPFHIFGYLDTYLRAVYGSSFKKVKFKNNTSLEWLISGHVPYTKYIERAKEKKVKFSAIKKNKKKLDKINKKVEAYNKIIDGYYSIVRRTEERFAMYEMYMPIKKLILKLHSDERYEELNEILKPYRSAIWACYKKGLGLCFDKEIFEITLDIIRREGSYTYVNKLRMMVPEQHWEPMVVTDYKGELVEITDISELLPEYSNNEEVLSK